MLILGGSKAQILAKKVARKLKAKYQPIEVKKFPDSELCIRVPAEVKGKKVIIIQSFHQNVNDCIIETLFAAETLKKLKAKSIHLVAPYFPYLRQDKAFRPGECISLQNIAKNIDEDFDSVTIIDPHLHRERTLKHIFKIKSTKLSANPLIEDYIKKHIKNPIIIGPDWESYKWAQKVAEKIGCDYAIMEKKRISARNVKIQLHKDINLKGKTLVIIDDMISTGHTLLQAIKSLKKLGAKNVTCFAVHGIFAENALQKLKGTKVITTNTIQNKASLIDVTPLLSNHLK